jgi:hypothetical protein
MLGKRSKVINKKTSKKKSSTAITTYPSYPASSTLVTVYASRAHAHVQPVVTQTDFYSHSPASSHPALQPQHPQATVHPKSIEETALQSVATQSPFRH